MKIGIISINAHTKVLNFASPLHTYAFWSFLKDNGIESTIIDYKPVYYGKYDPRHPLFYYIDHPMSDAAKQKHALKKWKNLFYEREIRYDRFEEFINSHYVKTDTCYTAKSMETEDPGFDCYICATDVIWKWNPNNGFDKGFLLACKCMEGKHKIAYAASRGATTYTTEQGMEFQSYLDDIDHISVREKSLQEYCQTLTDKKVTHVLDPVFLQSRKFYEDLAIAPPSSGYVLLYTVMEKNKSLVTTAVNFALEHGLEIIELSEELEDRKIPQGTTHDVIYDTGIEEWLGYMENAAYIFTNSFHACCFSIIFQKEFWAGKRAGDKIDSILSIMGLSSRRIGSEYEDGKFDPVPIQWKKVNKLYEEYYQVSKEFILSAIHDCETTPKKITPPRTKPPINPAGTPKQDVHTPSDNGHQNAPSSSNDGNIKKKDNLLQKLRGIIKC